MMESLKFMNGMDTRFHKKRVPSLNSTATSDISFMLLIFFLVTTSMDVDKGLSRQLPPVSLEEEQQSTDVEEGMVMKLGIGADNSLECDGKAVPVTQVRRLVEDFVIHTGKEHIIQLQSDRDACYDTYFQVQNEIAAAYNSLRDKRARKLYHRLFNECTVEEQRKLREEIPQRIAEVYTPVKGGGQ